MVSTLGNHRVRDEHYADPLLKVSIIPRAAGALGYAQVCQNHLFNVQALTSIYRDRYLLSTPQIFSSTEKNGIYSHLQSVRW